MISRRTTIRRWRCCESRLLLRNADVLHDYSNAGDLDRETAGGTVLGSQNHRHRLLPVRAEPPVDVAGIYSAPLRVAFHLVPVLFFGHPSEVRRGETAPIGDLLQLIIEDLYVGSDAGAGS